MITLALFLPSVGPAADAAGGSPSAPPARGLEPAHYAVWGGGKTLCPICSTCWGGENVPSPSRWDWSLPSFPTLACAAGKAPPFPLSVD